MSSGDGNSGPRFVLAGWISHTRGGVLGMKQVHMTLPGTAWIGLLAIAALIQGCAQPAGVWNGIFAADVAGAAKTCVAQPATPPAGQTVLDQMQMSDEGGWCGIIATHDGHAFDSYLLVTRPSHGKIYVHHVGTQTRIDYTPDKGFTGTDSFAVRMIPGDAVIQGAVTVTR
jgi:hypothetical protein